MRPHRAQSGRTEQGQERQDAQEEHVQQQGQKHELQQELRDTAATHVPQGFEPGLFHNI